MSGTKNGPLTPLDLTQTMLLRCLPSAKLCRKDLMTNSLEFPLHLPRLTTLWTRLVSSTNNGNYGAEPAQDQVPLDAQDLRYEIIQPKTKEPPMQMSKPSKPRNSLRKNTINEVKTMSVFTVESLATLLANVTAALVANEDNNASILYTHESLKPERTPPPNQPRLKRPRLSLASITIPSTTSKF